MIEINVNIKDFCERCGYKMGFVKDIDINRYLGDDDEFFVYVNIIFEENFKKGYCYMMYNLIFEKINLVVKIIYKRK